MSKSITDRQVELLTSAAQALRAGDRDTFGQALDDSYRLDLLAGAGTRAPQLELRTALHRAQTELLVADALAAQAVA